MVIIVIIVTVDAMVTMVIYPWPWKLLFKASIVTTVTLFIAEITASDQWLNVKGLTKMSPQDRKK